MHIYNEEFYLAYMNIYLNGIHESMVFHFINIYYVKAHDVKVCRLMS